MVRPASWSGCGSSPTVLPSRRGGIIGRQIRVTFESKLTLREPKGIPNDDQTEQKSPIGEDQVAKLALTK